MAIIECCTSATGPQGSHCARRNAHNKINQSMCPYSLWAIFFLCSLPLFFSVGKNFAVNRCFFLRNYVISIYVNNYAQLSPLFGGIGRMTPRPPYWSTEASRKRTFEGILLRPTTRAGTYISLHGEIKVLINEYSNGILRLFR